jgi:tetratricopeptide (TPR) repeat protein
MTMKKTLKIIAVFISVGMLSACNRSGYDSGDGRYDAAYKDAMAEYQAGRLDQAEKGFEKAVRSSPGNVSARFQLAVIKQERRDYMAAWCCYRECILLNPDGDRAALARERAAICEREVVRELLAKNSKLDVKAYTDEIERLKKSLADAEGRLKEAERNLSETKQRADSMARKAEKMARMLKAEGGGESVIHSGKSELVDAKTLLDGDVESTAFGGNAGNAPSVADSEQESHNRRRPVRDTGDIALLRAEEQTERQGKGSDMLPAQPEGAKAARDAAREAAKHEKKPSDGRPETYVVQDGDTLYRIAQRFYGNIKAWQKIRDANKTIISNDGRVRAGQKIRLP